MLPPHCLLLLLVLLLPDNPLLLVQSFSDQDIFVREAFEAAKVEIDAEILAEMKSGNQGLFNKRDSAAPAGCMRHRMTGE